MGIVVVGFEVGVGVALALGGLEGMSSAAVGVTVAVGTKVGSRFAGAEVGTVVVGEEVGELLTGAAVVLAVVGIAVVDERVGISDFLLVGAVVEFTVFEAGVGIAVVGILVFHDSFPGVGAIVGLQITNPKIQGL